MRAPLAPPRLSLPRKRRSRRPGRRDQLRDGQPGCKNLGLEGRNLRLADQLVIHRRDRILPDQLLLRNQRTKVPRNGPHVAMRQLVPRLRERIRKLLRIRQVVAAKSSRSSHQIAAQGPTSTSLARASSPDRAHPVPCPPQPHSWASTAARPPGSSSAPIRT